MRERVVPRLREIASVNRGIQEVGFTQHRFNSSNIPHTSLLWKIFLWWFSHTYDLRNTLTHPAVSCSLFKSLLTSSPLMRFTTTCSHLRRSATFLLSFQIHSIILSRRFALGLKRKKVRFSNLPGRFEIFDPSTWRNGYNLSNPWKLQGMY